MNDRDRHGARQTARRWVPIRATVALAAALLALVGLLATVPSTAAAPPGEKPVAVRIPAIGVAAPIEVRTTVANQMQDPTGPKVVAWYDDSARLGAPGNAVLAGHLDFTGFGPAIFADLKKLKKGDAIVVKGDDGGVFAYRVVDSHTVRAADGDWDEITGPTRRPSLTLITCAGPWDDDLGHYRDRLVVRAVRVGVSG